MEPGRFSREEALRPPRPEPHCLQAGPSWTGVSDTRTNSVVSYLSYGQRRYLVSGGGTSAPAEHSPVAIAPVYRSGVADSSRSPCRSSRSGSSSHSHRSGTIRRSTRSKPSPSQRMDRSCARSPNTAPPGLAPPSAKGTTRNDRKAKSAGDKLFFGDPTMYAVPGGDAGNAREALVVSQLKQSGHAVDTTRGDSTRDFAVDGATTIEVGGRSRKAKCAYHGSTIEISATAPAG